MVTRPIIVNCTVICLELMDIFECIFAVEVPPLMLTFHCYRDCKLQEDPLQRGAYVSLLHFLNVAFRYLGRAFWRSACQ